ncbi:hypothetical protein NVP1259O_30 [Vibrio phage 1.259.O._10N.286.48.F4]|nr:hypothetical protein NVP1259O_30 [Vibrio phage 1.259.O._10N.286.48.F4]
MEKLEMSTKAAKAYIREQSARMVSKSVWVITQESLNLFPIGRRIRLTDLADKAGVDEPTAYRMIYTIRRKYGIGIKVKGAYVSMEGIYKPNEGKKEKTTKDEIEEKRKKREMLGKGMDVKWAALLCHNWNFPIPEITN